MVNLKVSNIMLLLLSTFTHGNLPRTRLRVQAVFMTTNPQVVLVQGAFENREMTFAAYNMQDLATRLNQVELPICIAPRALVSDITWHFDGYTGELFLLDRSWVRLLWTSLNSNDQNLAIGILWHEQNWFEITSILNWLSECRQVYQESQRLIEVQPLDELIGRIVHTFICEGLTIPLHDDVIEKCLARYTKTGR